jgi:hypothetical protein
MSDPESINNELREMSEEISRAVTEKLPKKRGKPRKTIAVSQFYGELPEGVHGTVIQISRSGWALLAIIGVIGSGVLALFIFL